MLHFAPESALEERFKRTPGLDYLSADLSDERAMSKIDITDIQYPDESFDAIYCSHVLEHVTDDLAAMREIRRIVRRDGWVIFQVPLCADRTFEDRSIVDPAERERVFGQSDHVRIYGRDFAERLRAARFSVAAVAAGEIASAREVVRSGLKQEDLFFCTAA